MLPMWREAIMRPGDGAESVRALAHAWWDDEVGMFASIRYLVNPVRFGYFTRVLGAEAAAGRTHRTVLDVGCGGGLLSEEFARAGFRVAGVDPMAESIEAGRRHAAASGLEIDYRVAAGEALPFDDGRFDVVLCCDVLEHVEAVGPVLAEVVRVLRPGGAFLFDTINRTLESKLAVIKLMQEWPSTAFVPAGAHEHRKFIKPSELRAAMDQVGLRLRDLRGMQPRAAPFTCLRAFRRRARGEIDFRGLGKALRFGETRSTSVSYMGWATKSFGTRA
jgi:2-polyprenyl-6-hydroxyphenyl methylase/3-demethylubiquinone-9 3-methyltransferase